METKQPTTEMAVVPTTTTAVSLPIKTLGELQEAGKILAQTKMLGVSNPAEGFILVATCMQEHMSFLRFKQKYHLICGEISQKAENMLAEFRNQGGKYEIISRTPDVVEIAFECKGARYVEKVTWEELKHEKYVYSTKNPNMLKDNYSTPRRRMQMMWARAVSDGVRTTCPEVTQGSYTPEEIGDFENENANRMPIEVTEMAEPVQIAEIVSPAGGTVQQRSEALPSGNDGIAEVVSIPAMPPAPPMPKVDIPSAQHAVVPPPPLPPMQGEGFGTPVTVAPPPMPPQAKPPVSPFNLPPKEQAQDADNSNPNICPVGQFKGQAWEMVDDNFMKLILASVSVKGITPAHREAIEQSLNRRSKNNE